MQNEEVKNKAIRGVIALTGRTIFLQLISGVALVILQGFLNAAQIGVFVVVSSVIRIFGLFTDVGLGAALVQRKGELEEKDLRAAFTLQEILVATTVGVGFVLTSQVKSWARLDADGVNLYWVLLIIFFISSLKVIPSILLERRLAFEKQIMPQIAEAIVFNILAVYLAAKGYGIQSYTWAFLVSAIVGLPIYYLISPWKISVGFSKDVAKKLLSFGVAYQGKNFLAVIKDDLLTFFLSGLVGNAGVGYWGTAQRWAYFPYRFIVDSMTKVTFPAYARVQDNLSTLKSGIEKSLFAVSLTLFPILTLIVVSVSNLINIFPRYMKWEPALVSLYFLCAQAAVAGLTNILVNVLDATGKVKTTLRLMIMWIIATWVLTIIFIRIWGFTGISVAAFVVSLTIVVVIRLVKKEIDFNFFGSIWKQVLACIVMGIVVHYLLGIFTNNLIMLMLANAFGFIMYVVVMFTLAKNELIENTKIILKVYKR